MYHNNNNNNNNNNLFFFLKLMTSQRKPHMVDCKKEAKRMLDTIVETTLKSSHNPIQPLIQARVIGKCQAIVE